MKKILLILVLLTPLFCLSQNQKSTVNQIVTTDGKIYDVDIESYLTKKISFKRFNKELGARTIHVSHVKQIGGPVKKSRMNAILRGNPNIKFANKINTTENALASEIPLDVNKPLNIQLNPKTPGDLIQTSATLRLTGLGLASTTSILFAAGAFDELKQKERDGILIGSAAVSMVLYIAGEVTLIKAGKKMNKDAITLSAADSGIGVAINF